MKTRAIQLGIGSAGIVLGRGSAFRTWWRLAAISALVVALGGCATNPATGKTIVLASMRIATGRRLIYRFRFEAPPSQMSQLTPEFAKTTASFGVLSPTEAAALKVRKLQVVTVTNGDTVGGLARRMPFENYKLERFRVLNGLTPDSKLAPNQRLKLVVE